MAGSNPCVFHRKKMFFYGEFSRITIDYLTQLACYPKGKFKSIRICRQYCFHQLPHQIADTRYFFYRFIIKKPAPVWGRLLLFYRDRQNITSIRHQDLCTLSPLRSSDLFSSRSIPVLLPARHVASSTLQDNRLWHF